MVCLLPNAKLDIDILDGEIEMRQERDGEKKMFRVWVFLDYISIHWNNVAKKIFEKGENQYKDQCYVFFQLHSRL